MSASWLQLIFAIALMYAVVAAAGYWGQRRRAGRERKNVDTDPQKRK